VVLLISVVGFVLPGSSSFTEPAATPQTSGGQNVELRRLRSLFVGGDGDRFFS